MILTGQNYNLRSDSLEHQRLQGKGSYNESRAEHFLKLRRGGSFLTPEKKRNTIGDIMERVKPFVGGNLKPSREQQQEIVLRVNAEKPRKRIYNKNSENVKRSVSGRSTEGINRNRKTQPKQSYAIMRGNTKRQIENTQKIY